MKHIYCMGAPVVALAAIAAVPAVAALPAKPPRQCGA
jgi:hypothetical protein